MIFSTTDSTTKKCKGIGRSVRKVEILQRTLGFSFLWFKKCEKTVTDEEKRMTQVVIQKWKMNNFGEVGGDVEQIILFKNNSYFFLHHLNKF